jgi:3-phosphoshikimate 1-carboxyvinyltransferase
MKITITPHSLKGHVSVISSKSLSHRYVIAAGLSKGVSHVENVLDSDDLKATKDALFHLGVRFQDQEIHGSSWQYDGAIIDCLESGSTLRMMIPIFMMQDQPVQFTGRGRLPMRPLDVYEETFQHHRVTLKRLNEHALPLLVQGP